LRWQLTKVQKIGCRYFLPLRSTFVSINPFYSKRSEKLTVVRHASLQEQSSDVAGQNVIRIRSSQNTYLLGNTRWRLRHVKRLALCRTYAAVTCQATIFQEKKNKFRTAKSLSNHADNVFIGKNVVGSHFNHLVLFI
jgi:hypothetical protein